MPDDVYDYDSFLESRDAVASSTAAPSSRVPSRFIASMMEKAAARGRGREEALERRLAREREAEAVQFAGKEEFVTSAYAAKLDARAAEAVEAARAAEAEAAGDVRKRADMSDMYRNLLFAGGGGGGALPAVAPPTKAPPPPLLPPQPPPPPLPPQQPPPPPQQQQRQQRGAGAPLLLEAGSGTTAALAGAAPGALAPSSLPPPPPQQQQQHRLSLSFAGSSAEEVEAARVRARTRYEARLAAGAL
jgi:hypothetical protein